MSRTKITISMIATLLLLAACNVKEATVSPELFQTQIAQTAEVAEALTAMVVTPTSSMTPTLEVTNTLTSTPTLTPDMSVTKTPWVTNTRSSGSTTTCDVAAYMNVQTPPDFSTIPPGTEFKVTWTFKNLGPCTWTEDYRIVFSYVSDTGKDGVFTPPSPENFPETTLPGELAEISITLKAPTKADGYQVVFRLQNDKGFNFGPEFWIIFSVE